MRRVAGEKKFLSRQFFLGKTHLSALKMVEVLCEVRQGLGEDDFEVLEGSPQTPLVPLLG